MIQCFILTKLWEINDRMINFDFDKQCYGCRACENVCNLNAIRMQTNVEGFLVPVVNMDLCVECKLCEKVCPKLTESSVASQNVNDVIVSAYRKEQSHYKEYTSSGIFNELAKQVINNGGMVCGCVWNEKMVAEHILTDKIEDIARMSYSKYVQSDMKSCYKETKQALKAGRKVLFSGTPCQIAALKKYMEVEYPNLFTIAIVCHGTPSPQVWRMYKEKLESEVKAKKIKANFRYKGKYGWITPFSYYEFDNGTIIEKLSFTEDPYVIAFGADILHRNTCYHCKYKGSLSGADIVTGDFWGCSTKLLSKSRNKGISAVIIHTEKGKKLLDTLKDSFVIDESTSEKMSAENKPAFSPVKYNPVREQFYKNYEENHNLDYMYGMFNRRKYKVKRIMYKLSIFEILKRIKYIVKH